MLIIVIIIMYLVVLSAPQDTPFSVWRVLRTCVLLRRRFLRVLVYLYIHAALYQTKCFRHEPIIKLIQQYIL